MSAETMLDSRATDSPLDRHAAADTDTDNDTLRAEAALAGLRSAPAPCQRDRLADAGPARWQGDRDRRPQRLWQVDPAGWPRASAVARSRVRCC